MKRNFLGMVILILAVILVTGHTYEAQAQSVYQATVTSNGDRVGIVMVFFPSISNAEVNQLVATINGFLPFLSGSGTSVSGISLNSGTAAVNNALAQLVAPVLPNNWDAWIAAAVTRTTAPFNAGTNVRVDLFANAGTVLGGIGSGLPPIAYVGAIEINDAVINSVIQF